MRPHAALGGGGGPHPADDLSGGHLLPLLHRHVRLQAAVLGGVPAFVLNDHRGAHQLVVGNGLHGPRGGGLHRRALVSLHVDAVVGAPVGHGGVIQQLRHAEHRHCGAVQRGYHLGQQLCRLGDLRLLHRVGDDHRRRLYHRLGGGDGLDIQHRRRVRLFHGHRALSQGKIADRSCGHKAQGDGYVIAPPGEHGPQPFVSGVLHMRVPFLAGSPAAAPSGGRHAEIKHPLPVLSPDRGCFIHIQSSNSARRPRRSRPLSSARGSALSYRMLCTAMHIGSSTLYFSRSTISASTV